MEFATSGAPHMPPQSSVGSVMRQVLYTLVPGILAHLWFFGPGILVQLVIACGAALGFEYLMLRLRQRPVALFLTDGSALVTAVLFALCIPPLSPWWVGVTGMGFAIVLAKHLYGGLGFNIFNPAMVGYVVVLVAFPRELTAWLPPASLAEQAPGLGQVLATIFSGQPPAPLTWDAITQATPLDSIKTGIGDMRVVSEIRSAPIFGDFGGLGWEWIANFFALGGLFLMFRRIISWHVPVAIFGTVMLFTLPAYLIDPGVNPVPLQHIFSGGLVLGAFYIATDPVSGCSSGRGKLLFGVGVALITLAIRRWGGYPDGVAFGVLLMNMVAPLIDRYTRPRTYGHSRE